MLLHVPIPDADASVIITTDNHGSALPLRHRKRIYLVGVGVHGSGHRTLLQIPNADVSIVTSGDNHGSALPFGHCEGTYPKTWTRVDRHRFADHLTLFQIPEDNASIISTGDNHRSALPLPYR